MNRSQRESHHPCLWEANPVCVLVMRLEWLVHRGQGCKHRSDGHPPTTEARSRRKGEHAHPEHAAGRTDSEVSTFNFGAERGKRRRDRGRRERKANQRQQNKGWRRLGSQR